MMNKYVLDESPCQRLFDSFCAFRSILSINEPENGKLSSIICNIWNPSNIVIINVFRWEFLIHLHQSNEWMGKFKIIISYEYVPSRSNLKYYSFIHILFIQMKMKMKFFLCKADDYYFSVLNLRLLFLTVEKRSFKLLHFLYSWHS